MKYHVNYMLESDKIRSVYSKPPKTNPSFKETKHHNIRDFHHMLSCEGTVEIFEVDDYKIETHLGIWKQKHTIIVVMKLLEELIASFGIESFSKEDIRRFNDMKLLLAGEKTGEEVFDGYMANKVNADISCNQIERAIESLVERAEEYQSYDLQGILSYLDPTQFGKAVIDYVKSDEYHFNIV